ncbi:phage head morphogenesis protein [Solidesulfovibrio carbinolicus]|uniref:Phage head morphogenesis protein n=1 Tax=Solidesulfovibrio carbinolicus TaxID=296842 RepID=A0A4P6I029_9BACT|nr:phage minor head protein [Solidesulfovibrio carbinolicus]QAZ67039.1 phage head morphogenesis protein [Solidesulfovibrio carbinolicus]
MPKPVSLAFALGLPPADAVAYFESKGYKVTFNWHELDQAAHAQAFTVAKAASLDVLADIRAALKTALAEGKTEAWFRKDLEPKLRAKGWWGKKKMADPRTGEERRVQLGSPARLRLIYRQNLQTAFMAGRYKAMLENADARPWWQYVAVLDGKTRPSHKVLGGRTFRFDDPFWSSHYPPNGFNCRCRVRALSESRMEAEKVTPESGVGNMVTEEVTVPAADGQRFTRSVTGYRVPESKYVAFTDAGFSANPGASWLGGALDELTRKLDAAPPDLARAAVGEMTRGPVLGEWLAKPAGNFPLAVLPAEDAGLIGARCQVARLSPQTAGKQALKHPELGPDDYRLAQEAVDTGERVQESARKLDYVLDQPGGVLVVVKATAEGDELFVQSLVRLSGDDAKREREVRRLKKRSAPQ